MWSLTFRPGRFRSLAQLYAVRGRQAVSFSDDDRASLVRGSGELIAAREGLCGQGWNREAPARTTPRQSL
jgi:hypothetical protein